jgi:hypothetical protein
MNIFTNDNEWMFPFASYNNIIVRLIIPATKTQRHKISLNTKNQTNKYGEMLCYGALTLEFKIYL